MSVAEIELTPKGKRTRAALVAAGRQIIAKKRPQALTVMDVCDLAGIGRTSFYNYFQDAEELSAAIAGEAGMAIKKQFDLLYRDLPRGLQRLEKCLSMILATAVKESETVLLITSLAGDRPALAELVGKEIAAELHGARESKTLQVTDRELAGLAQFLTIATLAISREIALGRIGEAQLVSHTRSLMAACHRR